MLKKIALIIVSVLLLGISISSYFYFKKQKEYRGVNSLVAVPMDAELIVTFESLQKFMDKLTEDGDMAKELRNFNNLAEALEDFKLLSDLVEDNESNISLERTLTIATHLQGKDDIELLYILPIIDYMDEKNIIGLFKKLFSKSIGTRKYQEIEIYTTKQFNFAITKGMFIASKSKILLENSIRQIGSGKSIAEDAGFKQIRKTVGAGMDANIFINMKTFPKVLSFTTSKTHKKIVRNATNLTTWTELDLSIKNSVILLNGFTFSDIKERNYLNAFLQQEPVEINMEDVLPADISVINAFGFSDVSQYRRDYLKYLSQIGELDTYQKNMKTLKIRFGCNVEKLIYDNMFNEIGLVFSESSTEHPITVIRTKSASITEEKMVQAIKYFAKKNKTKFAQYKHVYRLDANTNFNIYKFPEEKLARKLFGVWFSNASSKYFAFIDNYMIMSHDIASLSAYLKSVSLGKTIATNKNYKDSKEYLSDKANFLFYASTVRCNKFLMQFMDKKRKEKFEAYKPYINKFQSMGLQLTSNQKLIYNNLFIAYNPVIEAAPQTVWESKLDVSFKHKPFLVKNHRTKATEILVQDEKNQVYLISNKGSILWKKPIGEKIVGEVKQIDCYRNNKLQYLFTTDKHLYLLDRNGNNVKNYPVILPATTEKGVSVFDYDKNRKYRIFVPCTDKKIYVYTREGKRVEGWKANKADNKITCNIEFYRVKNKDYLVYADKYRAYILNRRGDERVKIKKQFSKSERNKFYLDKRSNCLVTTDTKGTIYEVGFDGSVKTKQFVEVSPKHYFTIADVNADGRNEYVFADGNELKVFSNRGKLKWKKEFDGEISYAPSIYRFSKHKVEIGICIAEANKIYLLSGNGNNHAGFPLKGNTKFSVGFNKKDNKGFSLFVGNNRNFLLNYAVQ